MVLPCAGNAAHGIGPDVCPAFLRRDSRAGVILVGRSRPESGFDERAQRYVIELQVERQEAFIAAATRRNHKQSPSLMSVKLRHFLIHLAAIHEANQGSRAAARTESRLGCVVVARSFS
jgi:hypothetical protein